jgi:hypothetical protein
MNTFIILYNHMSFLHFIMSIFKNLQIKLHNFDPPGVKTNENKCPSSRKHLLPFQSTLVILRNNNLFQMYKVI